MKTLKEIFKSHYDYRKQLFKLAKSDIIKTYKGAALGWSWAIIRPAIQIFVFWFAFSFGLRSGKPVEGYPFFLWLIAGMTPWFYMRDMIQGGAASMRRYTYLITKIKYPVCTIPTFVSMSLLMVHIGLLAIVIVIYIAFGYMPDIYYLVLHRVGIVCRRAVGHEPGFSQSGKGAYHSAVLDFRCNLRCQQRSRGVDQTDFAVQSGYADCQWI